MGISAMRGVKRHVRLERPRYHGKQRRAGRYDQTFHTSHRGNAPYSKCLGTFLFRISNDFVHAWN